MKVKVFDCDHESDLEASINEFIQDKEIVDIKFSVSASVFGEEQIYCFSAFAILHKLLFLYFFCCLLDSVH